MGLLGKVWGIPNCQNTDTDKINLYKTYLPPPPKVKEVMFSPPFFLLGRRNRWPLLSVILSVCLDVCYLAKRRAFCKICFLVEMFVYLYICIFIYFLLQFFQISTRSVDHSFSAIVLKLDMYTRERNSVRRTKFRSSRSKVKVTRRSNIKINETLSFWVNFIGSSPNLVDI